MEQRPTLKLETKLIGHKGSVYCLDYSADGAYLYSAGGDGWIVQWLTADHKDGKLLAEVDDQVFAMKQVPGTDCIVAGAFSGNLYYVDPSAQEKARNLVFHTRGIYDLLIHNGKLFTAGGDGRIGIWDVHTMEISESIRISDERIRGLSLSHDAQVLAVAASDNDIYLLHLSTGKIIDVIEAAHENSVFDVAFSHCGQFLYSGGRDAHLKKWDLGDRTSLRTDVSAHWYTINALAVHPSGRWLATGSRDKTIRIWDTNEFSLIQSLDATRNNGHINSVNHLIWSPDGSILYAASDDRSISVWRAAN